MTSEIVPAKKQGPKATMQEWLESDYFRTEISKALPNGSPDAYRRAALTTVLRNQALLRVTRDSLFTCLFDLAQMGLYPDGRRAHLIPYGNVCTLVVDYKGIAELARKNGDVVYIHCDVVHEGETYACEYGTNGGLRHIPDPDKESNPIRCAYSFVKFKVPGSDILVEEYMQMSKAAIDRIRERSKAKNSGPWVTDYEEMAKKTVFRRHSKTLSLSPETRRAVEYGEEEEFGEAKRFRAAVPAIIPKRDDFADLDDLEGEKDVETAKKEPAKPAKPAKAVKPEKSEAKRDSRSTAPESPPESPDLLFSDTDSGTEVAKSMQEELELLLANYQIDRNQFFEFLNWSGIKHAKDESLKVLTYIDLKPSDLGDIVENWEHTFERFNSWSQSQRAS